MLGGRSPAPARGVVGGSRSVARTGAGRQAVIKHSECRPHLDIEHDRKMASSDIQSGITNTFL